MADSTRKVLAHARGSMGWFYPAGVSRQRLIETERKHLNFMWHNIIKLLTGTLVSRVFGFMREIIVASYFGTSRIADAFTLALIFPNLFRQILGEDMVERAFMPPFKTIYDQGEKARAWKFISVIFNWFFIILLVVTLVLYLIIPLFFSLRTRFPEVFGFMFASGNFDYDLSLDLILILLPFMLFIGLASLVGSILNFFEKNWIFAFAPVMLSLGVIVGIVFLKPLIGGYSIAVGYVLGALLQLLIQIPYLWNREFKKQHQLTYSPILKDPQQDFTLIKKESRIITYNAIFNKSSEVFSRFLATTLVPGATSSIFYAQRVYQLPFAILSLSISRAVNPILNRMKSVNDFKGFDQIYSRGLQLNYFLFIPVSLILIIASPELVNLLLRRGSFDDTSLHLTSWALIWYSIGLLPMSMVGYYTRVLSLFNKNRYALKISIIGSIINIMFSLVLIQSNWLSHAGIALANSLAFFINWLVIRNYAHQELGGFIRSEKSRPAFYWSVGILSIGLIGITRFFNLLYDTTKFESLVSLIIKSLLVGSIWLGLYLWLNPAPIVLRQLLQRFRGDTQHRG